MALPVITDVWRCTLLWRATSGTPSQICRTVVHVSAPGKTAATLKTAFDGAWQANQTAWLPNSYSLLRYDFLKLDGTSPTTSLTPASPIAGQNTGESIIAAAALVKVQTAVRGPKARGRWFLPFVSEAKQAAGSLDSTTVSNMQTAWSGWRTALIAAGVTPGVASYTHSEFNASTALVVETLLGTQRRRQQTLRR